MGKMKLLNNLFEIVESSGSHSGFTVTMRMFPDHIVYKGHFPGYPVTPGVILIQMIHELVEHYFKKDIHLVEISNCKFLKIVNPENESDAIISVNVDSKDGLIFVKAAGKNNLGAFFKIDVIYRT
jgi:3-hydroxyacyl-[acyl-carrier-protein] dehydratase